MITDPMSGTELARHSHWDRLGKKVSDARQRIARWFHIQPNWIDIGVIRGDETHDGDSTSRGE